MNYKLAYENLITRAKTRTMEGYTETHHIVPRCLGGSNDKDNLVELTPEEHFVAHQLLVKIHPASYSVSLAASMMTVGNDTRGYKNKRYGWLRRKHSEAMSKLQSGSNNSQSGTVWVYHEVDEKSKKISKNEISSYISVGWKQGRITDFLKYKNKCSICNSSFFGKRKTCSDMCRNLFTSKIRSEQNPLFNREKEFISLYEEYGSINRALQEMGFPGATSHYYDNAKRILKDNCGIA